jgi:protein-disulfide isomerase
VAKKVLIVLFAFSVLFLGFSIGRYTNVAQMGTKASYAAKQNQKFKDLDESHMAIALAVAASSPEIATEILKNLEKGENLPRETFQKLVTLSRKVAGGGAGKPQAQAKQKKGGETVEDLLKGDKVDVVPAGAAFKRGSDSAPVKVVTFTEFLCPFCGRLDPVLAGLQKKYGDDKVQLIFQSRIVHGERAAYFHRAATAAGEQGKFWEFTEALFTTQREWSRTPPDEAWDKVIAPKAKALGLNLDKLKKDMESDKIKALVAAEDALGGKLGVRGTPTSFVNGYMVRGAKPEAYFDELIGALLKK